MTRKVEWVDAAAKERRKLDKQIQRDILRYFREPIATDDGTLTGQDNCRLTHRKVVY